MSLLLKMMLLKRYFKGKESFIVAKLFSEETVPILFRVYESSISFPTFETVRHFIFCLSDSKPHSVKK